MEHRDYHGRRRCDGCRYWSELVARAEGNGPLEALCIAPHGPNNSRYMTKDDYCDAWRSGYLGAVDDPGEDPQRYPEEADR